MRSVVALIALSVSGCATGPALVDNGRVGVVPAAELPPPTRADMSGARRDHLIGPFDQLNVQVLGIAELSREEIRVDANGQILLPVAGAVEAAGRTPIELARDIETRLRAGHVRQPQVTVNITETVSQTVTVDGEVRRPGIYPIGARMTMMRAIARSEGLTESARISHVVVFRTVNNQQMAALYDLRAIRQGAYEDPQIYPNDVILVGTSEARRLFPVILQAAGVILTPIVYILTR